MLHIKPVYTTYEREEYSAACGFLELDGKSCVAALENGLIVGCALFRADNKRADITDIGFVEGYFDETARILLTKGTLNVLDLAGITEVTFSSENRAFVKGLGFREKDGTLTVSLEGYFDEKCGK